MRSWFSRLDKTTLIASCAVLYVFGASLVFAAVTPVGAGQDEPDHVAYAAAAVRGDLGQIVPGWEDSPRRVTLVTAPAWVNSFTNPPRSLDDFVYPCFATVVHRSAGCAPDLSSSTTPTEVPITVGRYPPAFHALVGLPTLAFSGQTAVYAMRFLSSGLAAALVALGLLVAHPGRRGWLGLAAIVAFTPTAANLAGSVNPSGVETAAALGLGVALLGLSDRSPPSRVTTAAIVILGLAVAWSRPLGYLVLLAVVALSSLVNGAALRAWMRTGVVVGLSSATVSALVFRIALGAPVRAASAEGPATGSTLFEPTSLGDALIVVEENLIEWGFDIVGRFGWGDHAAPGSVLVPWTLLVIVLAIFVMLGSTQHQRRVLVAIGLTAFVLTPLVAISRFINASAYQVRYHLPLAVLLVIIIAATADRIASPQHRRHALQIVRWGAVFAPIGTVISAVGSFHRYSFGAEAQLADFTNIVTRTNQWTPPVEILGIAVLGAATLLAAGLTVIVAGTSVVRDPTDHPVASSP